MRTKNLTLKVVESILVFGNFKTLMGSNQGTCFAVVVD